MKMEDFEFTASDWNSLQTTKHPGERGMALWKTLQFNQIRVRVVEYSPGYIADHWCEKGHILYVLEGKLRTELNDGRVFELTKGMSYQVADGVGSHRSSTEEGAKLFIVD